MPAKIKVTLYTTRNCQHCRMAKNFLQKLGIRFMEFDVERNQRAFKEFQRLGGRGVPVIIIGAARVDGFQPKKLEQALKKNQLI